MTVAWELCKSHQDPLPNKLAHMGLQQPLYLVGWLSNSRIEDLDITLISVADVDLIEVWNVSNDCPSLITNI